MATAANPQGIMALPAGDAPVDTGAPAQPQLGLNDSYDAVQQGLRNASPIASQGVNDELSKIAPMLDQLPDEVLDQLLQIVQYMHDNPSEYAAVIKELVDGGIIEAGDFPEEYDPEFISTLGMIIMHAKQSRQGSASLITQAPVPPANMARGGIAEAARMVASRGRGGDTMLAHINPEEAALLKARGGSGTINPHTGLPEFKKFYQKAAAVVTGAVSGAVSAVSGALKSVTSAVKNVLASPVGKIVATAALATFLGPGAMGVSGLGMSAALAAPIAAGTVTALGGGNLKQVLASAATAYLAAPGGPVSNYLTSMNIPAAMGITSAAGQAALNSGLIGTGVGLLTGQKLSDAVKGGLTSAATAAAFSKATEPAKVDLMGTKDAAGNPSNPTAAMTQGKAPVNDVLTPDAVQAGESAPVPRVQQPALQTDPSIRNAENPAGGIRISSGMPSGMPPDNTGIRAVPTSMGSPYDLANRSQGPGSSLSQFPTSFINQPTVSGKAPTVMDSLGRTYEGIKTGQFGEIAGGLGDLFFPSGEAGILRTYGPGVAAGLAGMGAMGGFTPKEPQKSELQTAMESDYMAKMAEVKAHPEKYALQNMPTAGYAYPKTSQSDVLVNKGIGYEPYTPPTYNTPTGAIGSRSVPQPYNTSAMYNFMPYMQYAADGGLMSTVTPPPSPVMRDMGGIASLATGGYPRRTGQISGPGTATSDSIPAMLSDGEFVMTAKAVRGAGKGSRLAGAKKMYALMHQLEQNAARG